MTREEIVKIIQECDQYATNRTSRNAADRILSAIEKEREGEVVLVVGEVKDSGAISDPVGFPYYVGGDLHGQQGQLIFRPTKAKEAGK